MQISDFEIWLTMAIEMNNCVADESLNAYAMFKKLKYEVRNITPWYNLATYNIMAAGYSDLRQKLQFKQKSFRTHQKEKKLVNTFRFFLILSVRN